MKRLRPRFSLRTLAIVMAMVAVYFGAWEATKRYGVPLEAFHFVENERSPIPLVIGRDEHMAYSKATRCYYVWLFGPTLKLPFEKELK